MQSQLDQLDLFDVVSTPVGRGATSAEDYLPPTAKKIQNLVGLEAMVRVINRWGGTHMDFPAHASSFHTSSVVAELAEEVGQADAFKIAEYWIGCRLSIPKCDRAMRKVMEREIHSALDKNVPAAELARRFKLTERTIWRIAKRL